MNAFILRLSVCSPNSQFAAMPVNACQNCRYVFFLSVFLQKFVAFQCSIARFREFLSFNISHSHCRYQQLREFVCQTDSLAAVTSDKNSRLTNFVSAANLFRLLMNAAFCGFCSITFRSNSFTDIESLAFTATIRRIHHSSHSILAAGSGESQCAGNPAAAYAPATWAISPLSQADDFASTKRLLRQSRVEELMSWIKIRDQSQ